MPHSRKFDPQLVKQELGIGLSSWERFVGNMRRLAERPIHKFEAMNLIVNVLGDPELPLADQPNQKALQNVYALYSGQGMGADLSSANGTAWGLLNAVTEYVDHERRARSPEYRLDSAWFGQGAVIKQRALDTALKLVA